jgi:hypothetical protein
MPTIKFVRVERDCPHNKDLRAGGDVRGIIYDFEVQIDGETRAKMERCYTGKGYYVQDTDGRPVAPDVPHRRVGRKVDSKADFLNVVGELLDAGLIPTLAQLAAKRDAEALQRAAKITEAKARQVQHAISEHSEALYSALKGMVAASVYATPAKLVAQKLIDGIDAKGAEWAAAVDAEPGRFNIY